MGLSEVAEEVHELQLLSYEREAAYSIGLDRTQALRRVILPQASRVSIPPLSNTFIGLVKDTTLASLILVSEMLSK